MVNTCALSNRSRNPLSLSILLSPSPSFKSIKRGRFEIVSAIIAAAQKTSSISRIINDTQLSSTQAKKYLDAMINSRLIEKHVLADKGKAVYQTTEQGSEFFKLYCELLILLNGETFFQNCGIWQKPARYDITEENKQTTLLVCGPPEPSKPVSRKSPKPRKPSLLFFPKRQSNNLRLHRTAGNEV